MTYKAHGQKGRQLDRLIDESHRFSLAKVPLRHFPREDVPQDYETAQMPVRMSYKEYRRHPSWDTCLAAEG